MIRGYKRWKLKRNCLRNARRKKPMQILLYRKEIYRKYLRAGQQQDHKKKAYYKGMLDHSDWVFRDEISG